MVREVAIVSMFEFRSTLGNAFHIRADSSAAYLLHPVFLRFLFLCLAMQALFGAGNGSSSGAEWAHVLIWLLVIGAGMIAGITLLTLLTGYGKILGWRRVYTPFFIVPVIFLCEGVAQVLVVLTDAGDWKGTSETLADLTRFILAALVCDMLHAIYVVPLHPYAQERGAPEGAESSRVLEKPLEDNLVEGGVTGILEQERLDAQISGEAGREIRIADKTFLLEDLLWIRTEDHYLNVVTRKGRSMLRAKLSDLKLLQDGQVGLQVNRSHWVAFRAIADVEESSTGQISLQLVTGDTATVARSRNILFRQLYIARRPGRAG